jgi:hypothetical protein
MTGSGRSRILGGSRAPAAHSIWIRNGGPLESPTSPFIADHTLCVTQSDGARRDNVPSSGGEVGPAPALEQAKISCASVRPSFGGLELPIR